MDAPEVAVEIPEVGDPRGKNWAKVVVRVDDSRSSGWAYEGDFIATGGVQDVPSGAVVLVYGEKGSRANPRIEARVYTANPDGTLSHHTTATGRAWARTLRDPIADLLEQVDDGGPFALDWTPELSRYGDAALVEELERRGHEVRLD